MAPGLTGKGINKKAHTETLYILILTNPEAAVRASTPGEPLTRAAAGGTEKPCRMVSPALCSRRLYTDIQLYLCCAMTVCTSSGSLRSRCVLNLLVFNDDFRAKVRTIAVPDFDLRPFLRAAAGGTEKPVACRILVRALLLPV